MAQKSKSSKKMKVKLSARKAPKAVMAQKDCKH
jgi:hypothetical protein